MKKIVITGSTRGLGLALSKEFLLNGDQVIISSRTQDSVDTVIDNLRKQFPNKVHGIVCDVTKYIDVVKLGEFALEKMSSIDMWINNAGTNGGVYDNLTEVPPDKISLTINTNITGTIYGCRESIKIMKKQGYGKIFNVEGLGSSGRLAPKLAPYGTSKRSIPYLTSTLAKEIDNKEIGMHTISPGMVLTDLLLNHINPDTAKIFNILAERPETVAQFLVPKMNALSGSRKSIQYLTKFKVMKRFLFAKKRKNKFFDESGNII